MNLNDLLGHVCMIPTPVVHGEQFGPTVFERYDGAGVCEERWVVPSPIQIIYDEPVARPWWKFWR